MTSPLVWFDISASSEKVEAVKEFYQSLFDWQMTPDDSAERYHHWITNDDQPWVAVTVDTEDVAGNWVPHIQVEDLDSAVADAVGLGAQVVAKNPNGPAGASTIVSDPGGSLIALWVNGQNLADQPERGLDD